MFLIAIESLAKEKIKQSFSNSENIQLLKNSFFLIKFFEKIASNRSAKTTPLQGLELQ